jgi:hypothetical protein
MRLQKREETGIYERRGEERRGEERRSDSMPLLFARERRMSYH